MKILARTLLVVPIIIGLLSNGSEALASLPLVEQPAIIQSSPQGIDFKWDFPPVQMAKQPDGSISVTAGSLPQLSTPGAPQVPVGYLLIALPAQANPTLVLDEVDEEILIMDGSIPLAPAPSGVIKSASGEVLGGDYAPVDQPLDFNPPPVEFEYLGVVRGVALGRLAFYPTRPEGESLRVLHSVSGHLDFNAQTATLPGRRIASDPMLDIIASQVVNPAQVTSFQDLPLPEADVPSDPQVTSASAIIEVVQQGISAITYTDLKNAGFPVDNVNPNNLHLSHSGIEIATDWDGDTDVFFESNERILFYADPAFSRWQASDTYILTETSTAGLRMGSRSASISGVPSGVAYAELLVEQNLIYSPDCLCGPIPIGRNGDRWVWELIKQPDRTLKSFPFSLLAVNSSLPAKLTVWLIGYTDTAAALDHRVRPSLNGTTLTPSQVEWNGKMAFEGNFDIPAGTLASSNNLTLSLPGISGVDVEGMWLDAFKVRYPLSSASIWAAINFWGADTYSAYTVSLSNITGLRAYDVTDPNNPQRLSNYTTSGSQVKLADPSGLGGRKYSITNNSGIQPPVSVRLKSSPISSTPGYSGAPYVIITHNSFASAMMPYISFRQGHGISILMENVQSLYDQYTYGRLDPEAIRIFLDQAYHTWSIPPLYVLLVGDGNSDPRIYIAGHLATLIPPYLANVDPWMGETAADNRFVAIDGDDILPDMMLGRWPVNTISQAQAVVQKVMQYEQNPVGGNWSYRYTYVTDDADPAGDFPAEADSLVGMFSSGLMVEKYYYPQGVIPTSPEGIQFINSVKSSWNNGQAVMTYIGHSSQHQWAAENIFHLNDVVNVNNAGRMPVLLELTCRTGSYHLHSLQSLDEELLRHPTNATVAVFGPTGLGISEGHVELAKGFLTELQTSTPPLFGDASVAGKINLATTISPNSDLIDTYVLLGDPYSKFYKTTSPVTSLIYLPLIKRK